jgi:protein O-mannosyl-transferase
MSFHMFGKWKFERVTLICVLLALCVGAVYLPAVFLDFTNYDDIYYVTENPHVRGGFTWESIGWAFTHTCLANWQPMTLISHALDCQIYGLKPGGHHLTSVIFHTANTIVLFLLLRSMTGAVWRSAVVAALFALHPLHVESVAWISERKDVLSTLFGLLSLWAYVEYTRRIEGGGSSGEKENALQSPDARPAILFYMLALVFFALGLMSKAMLVTWPCVMLLLDYWPLGRIWMAESKAGEELKKRHLNLGSKTIVSLVREKIPFFALSAAMCVITLVTFKKGEAIAPLLDVPVGTRMLNVVISYFGYIEKLI